MMSYLELLKTSAEKSGSIACMGMDPVIERIPIKGDHETKLSKFYLDILKRMTDESVIPASVKPNIAFFEQYGFEGFKALKTIINGYKSHGIPVILDAKRGDIGKTSNAYAKAIFEFWDADAVTIAPYMGADSVPPFIEYCSKGKGVYILTRTSNRGAKDIQDLAVDNNEPVYLKTASKICEWSEPGTGSVVGATYPQELKRILDLYDKSGKQIPLLIPGVGSQGGSAQDIMEILKNSKTDPAIHRINSSSAINFAFEKKDSSDYAECALEALAELIRQSKI
jgi:orotidine-5'-phosphate decarboxylase